MSSNNCGDLGPSNTAEPMSSKLIHGRDPKAVLMMDCAVIGITLPQTLGVSGN